MSGIFDNPIDNSGVNGYSMETSAGPQADGTYVTPSAGTTPAPTDAGGGAPASYRQDIIDVFKYGVGAYTSQKNQQAMLDYKRFEVTGGGLYAQGRPGIFSTGAQGQTSGLVIIAGVVILAVALLSHRS